MAPTATLPPRHRLPAVEWVQRNLFDGWGNSLLTLVTLGTVVWAAGALWRWAVAAHWDVVTHNVRLWAVGLLPLGQLCPEFGRILEQMDQTGQSRYIAEWQSVAGPRSGELSLSPLFPQALFPWESRQFAPLGRLLTVRDITAQKQVDQALRESEMRYRTMFEASADAILLETITGRILDCNSVACEMHGYTKEELLQLNVADLVPPEAVKNVEQQFSLVLEKGALRTPGVNRRKDGSRAGCRAVRRGNPGRKRT